MNIKHLQQEEDRITKSIATIKAELEAIDGEAYRECWLDSTQDRTGKKSYTRLRWFIDVAAKKKGCRTLRGDEVGKATRAIALWSELAQLEAELARVGEELRKLEELAARLGLKLPTASLSNLSGCLISKRAARLGLKLPTASTPMRQRRSDRTPAKPVDVQGIPNGTKVKVPRGWEAVITGYLGENRYAIRYNTGLPGQEDSYPAHCLTVE